MKKVLVAAVLVGVMSLTGISMTNARGARHGFDSGRGYGAGYGYCTNQSYSDQDKEKAAAFLDDTKELRKQIVVKKSERRALMKQENPDEKRVAQLTGEIYDLKNIVADKAKETFGDNPPPLGLMRSMGGFGDRGRGPRNF